MAVPANKTQFSIVGPEQQLGCVQIGGKYSSCLPCNFPVNELEVTPESGFCSFNVSGKASVVYNRYDNGPLIIAPPAQILDVECGLSQQNVLPPPHPAQDLEIQEGVIDSKLCHDGWWNPDQYQIIWLWSGDTKYLMNIYPNNAWYNVDAYGRGGIVQVGCAVAPADHSVVGPYECLQCNMTFEKVRYEGTYGGRCEFDTGGHFTEVMPTSNDAEASSFEGGPGQVLLVRCTIDRYLDPSSNPPALPQARPAVKTFTRDLTDSGVEPACDIKNGNPVVLVADNGVYAVNVPHDQMTYSLTGSQIDLGCVNIENQQDCQHCNQTYTSIRVANSFGACYISTDEKPPFRISPRQGGYVFGSHRTVDSIACGFPMADDSDLATRNGDVSSTRDEPSGPNIGNPPVVLVTSKGVYSVYPPGDQTPHTLYGAGAELVCTSISLEEQVCSPCEGLILYAQVPKYLGSCFFYSAGNLPIEAKSGGTKFLPVIQATMIACGSSGVSRREMVDWSARKAVLHDVFVAGGNADDIASRNVGASKFVQGPTCDLSRGDPIVFVSQTDVYYVNPPSDGRTYIVSGPGLEIGCLIIAGGQGCLPCDGEFLYIQVPASRGTCWIGTSEGPPLRAASGITTNLSGIAMTTIACGPRAQASNDRNAGIVVARRKIAIAGVNTAAPSSSNQNKCPTSASWKVVITAADGHIYFAPIPLDLQYHPTPWMHCVRLADAACIPCDQIGPVVGVSTSIKWGPCIFFFNDRAAVNTWYLDKNPTDENSQVIDTVWFGPAGVIAGVECGTP